ncbi:MAG: division/cell wall cluster transcriptional repressor MraZ [Terracidiphilus sp.]|jgi:MraZ protein
MTDGPEFNPNGEPDASMEVAGGTVGVWDDLQVGFSGNPKAKLDDRGRLKLPAEFKAFVEKKYGKDFNAFYIVSREGEDAEIYPMPEWQQHLAKVFQMPKSLPARKKLLERYSLYGDRADMDPQGRLLMPEELRNAGMVNVDVKVSGEGTLLRVKSLIRLRESVKASQFSAEEVDSLTEHDV